MRRTVPVALLALLLASSSVRAEGRCRGEALAVVPLEPLALSPEAALEAETQLRMSLGELSGVCLSSRKHSADRLRGVEGNRLPPCGDAACRAKWARHFGARWLVSGTVFGLGGTRTVNLVLWSEDGSVVQRASYPFAHDHPPREVTAEVFREARLGRSLIPSTVANTGVGTGIVRKPHPVQWALGGAALVALASGGVFGHLSTQTANRLENGQTGCVGSGEDYQRCFAAEHAKGRSRAGAANALYATGALLGAGAVVTFAVDWP